MMTALWSRPAFSHPSLSPRAGALSVKTRVYTTPIHHQDCLQSSTDNISDTSINNNNKTRLSLNQNKKIIASHMSKPKIAWTFVHDCRGGISPVWIILHGVGSFHHQSHYASLHLRLSTGLFPAKDTHHGV